MKKVITYGTYDLLHYGHIRLLERAKKLGDYLIVAVTADDFDRKRGKINVKQSLAERIEAVRQTGLADEIIIEEYEGQKIDDIKRYNVDIFTVGSDWEGKFDYLNEYCKVVYLDRTQGISSSKIRSESSTIKMGIYGDSNIIKKYLLEDKYVNSLEMTAICTKNSDLLKLAEKLNIKIFNDYKKMLDSVDSVYIVNSPINHYKYIKVALENGKHVLCESPVTMTKNETKELYKIAKTRKLILMEGIKTAYSTAFNRLILLIKSGEIGKIVSIDCTCTSLEERNSLTDQELLTKQNSICGWGPTGLLPAFMLLGTKYKNISFVSKFLDENKNFDLFTKISINYDDAISTITLGKGVKSEGDLVISGTKGYVYVPAPWWKTDYFELRFEKEIENKRYFYQLDGEGIRYELVTFVKSIENKKNSSYISENISNEISSVIEKFNNKKNMFEIK